MKNLLITLRCTFAIVTLKLCGPGGVRAVIAQNLVLVGTMRREFLDHVLFWNDRDLERKLADFQTCYNAARSHATRRWRATRR